MKKICEADKLRQRLKEECRNLLQGLSDDDRLELFSDYCQCCGRDNADSVRGCQCWNDE